MFVWLPNRMMDSAGSLRFGERARSSKPQWGVSLSSKTLWKIIRTSEHVCVKRVHRRNKESMLCQSQLYDSTIFFAAAHPCFWQKNQSHNYFNPSKKQENIPSQKNMWFEYDRHNSTVLSCEVLYCSVHCIAYLIKTSSHL